MSLRYANITQASRKSRSNRIKTVVRTLSVISLLIIVFGKVIEPIEIDSITWLYGVFVTLLITIHFFTAYRYYRDPALDPVHPSVKNLEPRVSCVVAVKNEEKIIEQCVRSMLNQTYKNIEVVVTNDGSTDGTGPILDDLAAKEKRLKVIHLEKNMGKKKALSLGITKITGEIIVFTDSDSVLAETAVERLVQVFLAHPEIGAVTGHGRPLNVHKSMMTKIQDSWYEGQFRIVKGMESSYGAVTCCSGCLSAYRKEAIGPFVSAWAHDMFLGKEFRFATDRTLTGYVLGGQFRSKNKILHMDDAEDREMTSHMLKQWEVAYCESAKVLTEVPDTLPRFIRQQIRWKKSFIRNMFFTGSFYWRKPKLMAFVYYTSVLFTLISPFIAFRAIVLLPLQGDIWSGPLYLAGIIYVSMLFGLDYKLHNPNSHYWIYRPLLSLLSTLVISWLIFYSALTINKNAWLTR
jgi:cellulose synthase/poly-beta-1,6-N-acetylglucosamine synthase-like glycosyltransferase